MISLLIETSTERGIIAMFREKELLQFRELPIGLQNSKHLLSELQVIFKKAALTPKDIQLIVVGIGPGSYTGIRVGAMTAKALAYALHIPLLGISSLEGFVPENAEENFAAIIDAKMGGVYLKLQQHEPTAYSLEEALPLLKDVKMLVSPNTYHLQQKMPGPWNWLERYPDPDRLMQIALDRYYAGKRDDQLELMYLRKTQAEIEKGL